MLLHFGHDLEIGWDISLHEKTSHWGDTFVNWVGGAAAEICRRTWNSGLEFALLQNITFQLVHFPLFTALFVAISFYLRAVQMSVSMFTARIIISNKHSLRLVFCRKTIWTALGWHYSCLLADLLADWPLALTALVLSVDGSVAAQANGPRELLRPGRHGRLTNHHFARLQIPRSHDVPTRIRPTLHNLKSVDDN